MPVILIEKYVTYITLILKVWTHLQVFFFISDIQLYYFVDH